VVRWEEAITKTPGLLLFVLFKLLLGGGRVAIFRLFSPRYRTVGWPNNHAGSIIILIVIAHVEFDYLKCMQIAMLLYKRGKQPHFSLANRSAHSVGLENISGEAAQ